MERDLQIRWKANDGGAALAKSHPDPLPLPGISARIREFGQGRQREALGWRQLPVPGSPLPKLSARTSVTITAISTHAN